MISRPPGSPFCPAWSRYLKIVKGALSPWTARQAQLNLAETGGDPARFWSPQAYERLRRIKAAVDPQDVIRANHSIPPASHRRPATLRRYPGPGALRWPSSGTSAARPGRITRFWRSPAR
jgi:hypothetical protein